MIHERAGRPLRTPLGLMMCAIVLLWAVRVVAQPALLPDTSLGPLDSRLRDIEELVWSNPWQARESLQSIATQVPAGAAVETTAYYLLLAQSLLYLNDDESFSAAIDAGLYSVAAETPQGLRLFLTLLRGISVSREGRYDLALSSMADARASALNAGLDRLAALIAAEMGYVHTQAGDHEDALQLLQIAYEESAALEDAFLLSVSNEIFGVLYTYLDELSEAIRFYDKALQGYEELGYPIYVAEAAYGIGTTHRYAGNYREALEAFRRYQEMTEQRGDLHGEFSAAYGLGSTYADMGDCERALPIIEVALASDGPEDYKAELLRRTAVCRAQAGDGPGAREDLQRARDIIEGIEELKGSRWDIGLLESEARVLAALGEYEAAFDAMERFHAQKSELMQRNASERRLAQREALDNARKSLEIELLQEQARVRTLEIARQQRDNRTQRIGAGLLLVLLLLSALFAWWRLRDMRRLRELSTQDSLTGLSNRRHIFHRLEVLLSGLSDERGDLALLILDVDDFKAINDRFGHPVGDLVLQSLASTLRDALRPGDEVARIGGEEFMMVLPRTDPRAAMGVAWRVHECIQDLPVNAGGGKSVPITASIGVATTRGRVRTADALYRAADEALYRAKKGGKNRCELASPKATDNED